MVGASYRAGVLGRRRVGSSAGRNLTVVRAVSIFGSLRNRLFRGSYRVVVNFPRTVHRQSEVVVTIVRLKCLLG